MVLKITQSKSFDKMDKTLPSDVNQMCPFIQVIILDFVVITRGDQKVRGKVLLNRIAFIDCTTIHSKLTEIEI